MFVLHSRVAQYLSPMHFLLTIPDVQTKTPRSLIAGRLGVCRPLITIDNKLLCAAYHNTVVRLKYGARIAMARVDQRRTEYKYEE